MFSLWSSRLYLSLGAASCRSVFSCCSCVCTDRWRDWSLYFFSVLLCMVEHLPSLQWFDLVILDTSRYVVLPSILLSLLAQIVEPLMCVTMWMCGSYVVSVFSSCCLSWLQQLALWLCCVSSLSFSCHGTVYCLILHLYCLSFCLISSSLVGAGRWLVLLSWISLVLTWSLCA